MKIKKASIKKQFDTQRPPSNMAILMLVCVLVCITAGPSSALEDDNDGVINYAPYSKTWETFKKEYDRQYTKEEEKNRYTAFVEHLKTIEEHNKRYRAKETSFFMGIGPFTDRLPEDDGFIYNVLDDEDYTVQENQQFCNEYTPPLNCISPTSLNWTEKGAVTPVGNQGGCGSCYAFGAVAAIEAQLYIKTGTLIELSKQQFVDCHKKDCNGSTAEKAFSYVYDAGGIMSEADYPYRPQTQKKQGTHGPCDFQQSKVKTQLYGCLSSRNETDLKHMVASQGPVYISFAVTPSFLGYEGGIYSEEKCMNNNNPKHSLVVVGYGSKSGNDYWIVKNSWGTAWGESMKGYALIKRGVNMCGIADRTAVPEIGAKFNREKKKEKKTPAVEDEDNHVLATVVVAFILLLVGILACHREHREEEDEEEGGRRRRRRRRRRRSR
ncbi:digestive cysteine proteinase 1-like [Littorina saxatilis]|uniref:digestive cysteine proteinase 1-like n=1 Tax=Littorina saxatilis TaxID=31220 RepID=UPI0038B5D1F3